MKPMSTFDTIDAIDTINEENNIDNKAGNQKKTGTKQQVRFDHELISGMVESQSKVLDLGCATGELLVLLREEKQIKGQGIEISEAKIYECVEKGLSVFHMNIDEGLSNFPDRSFDYVILNQSLQETLRVEFVLREALRVGRRVIVGFPNIAYTGTRFHLFFRGTMPIPEDSSFNWYNTPNLHFLSITDFENFVKQENVTVLDRKYFRGARSVRFRPNLFAKDAVYLIQKN